jgi:hypothetical protein
MVKTGEEEKSVKNAPHVPIGITIQNNISPSYTEYE